MRRFFLLLIFFIPIISFAQNTMESEREDDGEARKRYLRNLILKENDELPSYKEFFEVNEAIEKRAKAAATKTKPISSSIPNIFWQEQGPYGIGGRCRAIMFDPNSTTKVWAGGAAGGLWYKNDYTTDATLWTKVNDFWENLAITAIAYDPSNTQIFYVGTGERAPGGGFSRNGGGIWKTTDGGNTWNLLPNTRPSVDNKFFYIQKIVVSTTGKVYVACYGGLVVSTNGGTSWYDIDTNYDTNFADFKNYFDDVEISSTNEVYASYRNGNSGFSRILKVSTTDVVTDITPSGMPSRYRIELALAPSTSGNNQVIYSIAIAGFPTTTNDLAWVIKSSNNGSNWSNLTQPTYQRNGVGPVISFTSNGNGLQGDYDLAMAVHPTNSNLVIIGGATNGRTTDGGSTWNISNYYSDYHPDNHTVMFVPSSTNRVLIGCDGGIIYSSNYGDASNNTPTFSTRNYGFRVTEFYRCAIKNLANDNYTLAGSQDNGTTKMTTSTSLGLDITNNDGMYCFIDQNEPNIQIVSIQNINHYLHDETSGTNSNLLVANDSNPFVNPCDYDSQNNVFYAYAKSYGSNTKFYRVSGVGGTLQTDTLRMSINKNVSYIKVGKTSNVIFVGTNDGLVYKITLSTYYPASNRYDINFSLITPSPLNYTADGPVNSIEIGANDNELIVVKSPYNVISVYYTNDGGTNWIAKDSVSHGLPNIPVFDAIFNPNDRRQVLLATELGVFSTMNITAANPEWEPTDSQLAHVRCMRFVYRSADNTVALATHGRGVFKTKFSVPCPTSYSITTPPVGSAHYEASSIINSNTTLPSSTLIRFDAGNKVSLTSGFKAIGGVHFKAYIDGCGGNR